MSANGNDDWGLKRSARHFSANRGASLFWLLRRRGREF